MASVLQLWRALSERGFGDHVRQICKAHHVRTIDILSGSRVRSAVAARRQAYFEFRRDYSLSYEEVGALFGRDHTTVMSGIRKYEALRGSS
jgi:chromosomal replication initiation ATPase DnaA